MSQVRVLVVLVVLAAAGVLSACGGGDGPSAPGPQPGIRAVAAPSATDTVGATATQALVVEVRSAEGRIAPGVVVRFEASEVPAPVHCRTVINACGMLPSMRVADPADDTFTRARSVVTNADGRAVVRVRFGSVAGPGAIVATAPELGLQETLRFTVSPGSAHQAAVTPRDTTTYLATELSYRASVVDRYGNVRPESAVITGDAGLLVQGTRVSGRDYGAFHLRARYGDLPGDSVTIAVVPRGTLAAVIRREQHDSIVLVDFDGSNRRTFPLPAHVHGLDWAPDGSRLVVSLGSLGDYPRRLHFVALDGATTPVFPGSTLLEEVRPVFSANGQWLFFVGWLQSDTRQVWRARADGAGREQVTSTPISYSATLTAAPSPDGSRVALAFGIVSGTGIHDIVTGRYSHLPLGAARVFRWSPDGARIAFGDSYHGPRILNVDGSGIRELVGYVGHDEPQLDWSPDGKWILFHAGIWQELLEVDTGKRIPLFHTGRGYEQAVWKP